MSTSPNFSLLIVEDSPILRQLMQTALQSHDLAIRTAATIAEAQQLIAAEPPQIILGDLALPDGNGLTLLDQVRTMSSPALVIVVTGNNSFETATAALRLGAFDYLVKPINVDFLLAAVRRATENIRLHRTIEAISRSRAHEEAMRATALAAAHHLNQDLTVIQGEIQLLQENPLPEPVGQALERMAEAVQRATTIIRTLQQARSFVTEYHDGHGAILDLFTATRR